MTGTTVVGDFDGVLPGHLELLAACAPPVVAVVVDDPAADRLLTTVERRLELLAAAGVEEARVAAARPQLGGREVVEAPRLGGDVRDHVAAGRVRDAAALLGRPPELEGTVVGGDARGTGLGFPTANLALDPRLLVPRYGIYAGAALGHRAAISIGTNPHYGGGEQRIEAFLLDFEGDLYGRRLVVELWERLRDERAFATEAELVEQIARDVEAARAAVRP
ncbi:MAG TPA: riboflavin kinase [Gaiellaceae bacterium]|nr:riboflavin kinase [Gaiellaceae bacterium]